MSDSDTVGNERETGRYRDDVDWILGVMKSVSPGDEIELLYRERPLTVSSRFYEGPKDNISRSKWQFVELEGNGREYRIAQLKGSETTPNLEIKRDGEYDKLESIAALRVVGGPRLLSQQSAEAFIEPTVEEPDTLSGALDGLGEGTDADGERLGDCPDCDGTVVASDGRATCSDCPLWCPRDEWDAFYRRADQ